MGKRNFLCARIVVCFLSMFLVMVRIDIEQLGCFEKFLRDEDHYGIVIGGIFEPCYFQYSDMLIS